MSFAESIGTCFSRFQDFSGRASRSEFWWFHLFLFIAVGIPTAILSQWIPYIDIVVFVIFLMPTLAVATRRLHDTNRSGWWLIFPLILFVSVLVLSTIADETGSAPFFLAALAATLGVLIAYVALLVFLIQSGSPGPNQYGRDPLEQQQGGGSSGYTQTVNPSRPPPGAGGHDQSAYDVPLPTTEPESGPVESLFCTQCGRQLQPGARFCMVCGTAI